MTTNRISNLFKKFALALIAIAIFIAGRFSAQPVVTVEAGGPPPGVKLVMDADRATDCILLCGTQSQLDQAVLNWVSNDDGGNDDSIVTPTPTPTTTTTVTVTPTKTPVTPTPRPSITPSSTPEITPTPDVTSTPIPQTPEPEKTKANCGVGNGEDGDTPGCPGGSKDGPGTGPGNPGAGGGNNK